MSANVYWRLSERGYDLNVDSPSTFIRTLEETFGTLPVLLTGPDVKILMAMAQVWDRTPNPYEVLAEAIAKHGEIEVYAEY